MRQILLFAGLVASLALLVGCGAVKGEPNTAEDVPDKAEYHKISGEEAYEMMILRLIGQDRKSTRLNSSHL